MNHLNKGVFLVLVLALLPAAAQANEQQFADMGDFALENGQSIREMKLGYRTYGTLNKERSNAILFPTWFMGTTSDLETMGLVGEGKLLDPSKRFIITVDSIGNGVSTSPSNSKTQGALAFPKGP